MLPPGTSLIRGPRQIQPASPGLTSTKFLETTPEKPTSTHKKCNSFKRLSAKLLIRYAFLEITPKNVIRNTRSDFVNKFIFSKNYIVGVAQNFKQMFRYLKMVTYHAMDKNAERNPKYQGENQDGTYDVVS